MKRIDISLIEKIGSAAVGFTEKYWIEYLQRKYLVKISGELYADQDYMEYLASLIFKRMGIPVVNVLLANVNNQDSCLIESYLHRHLEEVQTNKHWIHVCISDNCEKEISIALYKMNNIFNSLEGISVDNLQELKRDYIRMLFGDVVINNEERMIKNISIIFDQSINKYFLAPAYDHGLAFHAFHAGPENPVNYIGNDYFSTMDVLNYLLKHHYEEIEDLLIKLELLSIEIERMLTNNSFEIDDDKKIFIIKHIKTIHNICLQKAITKKH